MNKKLKHAFQEMLIFRKEYDIRSLDLHKEMKISRSGLNESQYKKHCFLFLMILKDNCLKQRSANFFCERSKCKYFRF